MKNEFIVDENDPDSLVGEVVIFDDTIFFRLGSEEKGYKGPIVDSISFEGQIEIENEKFYYRDIDGNIRRIESRVEEGGYVKEGYGSEKYGRDTYGVLVGRKYGSAEYSESKYGK